MNPESAGNPEGVEIGSSAGDLQRRTAEIKENASRLEEARVLVNQKKAADVTRFYGEIKQLNDELESAGSSLKDLNKLEKAGQLNGPDHELLDQAKKLVRETKAQMTRLNATAEDLMSTEGVRNKIHDQALQEGKERDFEKAKELSLGQLRPEGLAIAEAVIQNGKKYQEAWEAEKRSEQAMIGEHAKVEKYLRESLEGCSNTFEIEVLRAWQAGFGNDFLPWLEKTQAQFGFFGHGKEKKAIKRISSNKNLIIKCALLYSKHQADYTTARRFVVEEPDEILKEYRRVLTEAWKLKGQIKQKFDRSPDFPIEVQKIISARIERELGIGDVKTGAQYRSRGNSQPEGKRDEVSKRTQHLLNTIIEQEILVHFPPKTDSSREA